VSPFVRTVKTASGARAVQIVWGKRGGRRDIEHVGSAHDERELAVLKGTARQAINRGQGELDLALGPAGSKFRIVASRSGRLWDALMVAYAALGFDVAVPDAVFGMLALARVVEPTSKLDTIRVLEELGVPAPSYSTIQRRLRDCVAQDWRMPS